MDSYGFARKELENGLIGVYTFGLDEKGHPNLTMVSSKEFIHEDIHLLINMMEKIVVSNHKYYDHYMIIRTVDGNPKVIGFLIKEPDGDNLRVVRIGRDYYIKEVSFFFLT